MELANILRAAITASKKTQLELSALTKVPQQRISAFMRGGDMKLRHAGALMDVPEIRKYVAAKLRSKT